MSHSEIILNKYSILNQKILGSLALVSLLVADKCLCQHLSFVLFSLNVYAAIKDWLFNYNFVQKNLHNHGCKQVLLGTIEALRA